MVVDAPVVIALLSIVIGILIIAFPALLRILVGGYLIAVGLLTLLLRWGGA